MHHPLLVEGPQIQLWNLGKHELCSTVSSEPWFEPVVQLRFSGRELSVLGITPPPHKPRFIYYKKGTRDFNFKSNPNKYLIHLKIINLKKDKLLTENLKCL